MTAAVFGKQAALLTIHGSRLGISQADNNGMSAILLDGYAIEGLSGITYKSAMTAITALASGGQTSLSSLIANAQYNIISTVATTSDSVMLPSTAGKIPPGGCVSLSYVNRGANAAAIFPSSGEQINSLGANASIAIASSGITNFVCASSGQWYTK